MEKTYQVTGMTCQHCVMKVKKALESIEGVNAAEVTLDPPRAVVQMTAPIPVEALNEVLGMYGAYALQEDVSTTA
jgi:Cu2+-exporting ATPase